MQVVVRIALSLLPLALTPVLGHLLAQGYINRGGGEKDIIVLVPWLLWSLFFAISCWVLWRRGLPTAPALWRSALIGVAGVAFLAVALAVLGQLGIGGLF